MLRAVVVAGWLLAVACPLLLDPAQRPVAHAASLMLAAWFGLWGAAGVLLRWRTGTLLKRFVTVSVSLALVVGLAELAVGLGLVDFRQYLGSGVTPPWLQPHNRTHPTLLHVHRPHSGLRGTQVGGDLARCESVPAARTYHYDVSYDARGFRNEEGLTEAAVVVVGDSFVEGVEVAAEDLCTARLASELGVPVANFGQSHYGPQQALEALRIFGVDCRPKVCVWVFYEGNDLDDARRYDRMIVDWEEKSQAFHSFAHKTLSRNAVQALRRWVVPDRETAESGARTGMFCDEPLHFARRQCGRSLTSKDEPTLRRIGTVFEQAASLCSSRGIKLVVVYNPTKYRVYGPLCRFTDSPARPWVMSDLPRRIEGIIRGLPGAPAYLDLTPPMSKAAAAGELVFLVDDTHWSEAGHRLFAREAAKIIAPFLR